MREAEGKRSFYIEKKKFDLTGLSTKEVFRYTSLLAIIIFVYFAVKLFILPHPLVGTWIAVYQRPFIINGESIPRCNSITLYKDGVVLYNEMKGKWVALSRSKARIEFRIKLNGAYYGEQTSELQLIKNFVHWKGDTYKKEI